MLFIPLYEPSGFDRSTLPVVWRLNTTLAVLLHYPGRYHALVFDGLQRNLSD
jgi:hypothetical protein